MVDTPAIKVSVDSPPYQTTGDLIQNTIDFANDIILFDVGKVIEAMQIDTFANAFIIDSVRTGENSL